MGYLKLTVAPKLSTEVILVAADFNGHVGRAAETYERVHGGFGYGLRNTEGENILRTRIGHYAIFILRTFMEAHVEKRRALDVAFLDLQKAFDCVPPQCIWWALRSLRLILSL